MTNPSAVVPRRDSKVGRPPLPTATHTPRIKHWLHSSKIHETLPEEFSFDAKRWGGGAGPGCRRRPDGPVGPGGAGATSHDGKGALRGLSRSARAFLMKLRPLGFFMMTNPSAMVPRRDSKVDRPAVPTPTHTPPIEHWLRSSKIRETSPGGFSCDAKRWGGCAVPGRRRRPGGPGGAGATSHDHTGALRRTP